VNEEKKKPLISFKYFTFLKFFLKKIINFKIYLFIYFHPSKIRIFFFLNYFRFFKKAKKRLNFIIKFQINVPKKVKKKKLFPLMFC